MQWQRAWILRHRGGLADDTDAGPRDVGVVVDIGGVGGRDRRGVDQHDLEFNVRDRFDRDARREFEQ